MVKKIAAVLGGVLLGLIIAFARAGAFPFWGSSDKGEAQAESSPPQAVSSSPLIAPAPAAPNSPEPNERSGVVGSFAPLVKHVWPTVVSVRVVQDVKTSGMVGPFGEGDEGGGGGGGGDEGMGPPGSGDPFEQFRRYFGQVPWEYKQRGIGSATS
jgi:S1-C subfamily serine protease